MANWRHRFISGAWCGGGMLGVAVATCCLVLPWRNDGASAKENDRSNACQRTARNLVRACRYEARSDYYTALGNCENLSSPAEKKACQREALADLKEAHELCSEQFEARDDICDDLPDGPYNPQIRPADFVAGINNPFFPLVPGTTFIYEGNSDAGLERVEFAVTHNTRTILGVTCIEIHDTATVAGELVEDTLDWFAQDKEGNVWYFGEASKEIENGEIVSLEGSWRAGVDGARPGIVMEAHPRVGDTYRQEFLLGEAEDMAEVLSLKDSATVPAGSFMNCLKTKEFTAIEPDANENKIYAPGVGLVLEVNVRDGGTRTELVQILKE